MTDTLTPTTADPRRLIDLGDNIRQDLGDLTELVTSIHALGIIEPIVVDDEMQILAGHRRTAAAIEAGLTEVPIVVRRLDDDAERAEIMLVENLQREALNPIEEATGYRRLVDMGMTQRDIAERVGCNQSHVSKRLTLAELPTEAQAMVVDGSLAINDALILAKLRELNPESAAEWLENPGWPNVDERLRRERVRIERERRLVDAKKAGLIDIGQGYSWDSYRPVDSIEEATHHTSGAMVEFLVEREQVVEDDTDDEVECSDLAPAAAAAPKPTLSPEATDRAERRSMAVGRQAQVMEWVAEALNHPASREWLVEITTRLAAAVIRCDEQLLLDWPEGLDMPDDAALMLAIPLAAAAPREVTHQTTSAEYERIAAEMFDEIGIELTDAERELLPKVPDETEVLVSDNEPEASNVVDLIRPEGRSTADLDEYRERLRTTPPWAAYVQVDEVRLISGIAEHVNVEKLRQAVIYEIANDNREPVLDALAARINELDGGLL